jgi:hypothetical protein
MGTNWRRVALVGQEEQAGVELAELVDPVGEGVAAAQQLGAAVGGSAGQADVGVSRSSRLAARVPGVQVDRVVRVAVADTGHSRLQFPVRTPPSTTSPPDTEGAARRLPPETVPLPPSRHLDHAEMTWRRRSTSGRSCSPTPHTCFTSWPHSQPATSTAAAAAAGQAPVSPTTPARRRLPATGSTSPGPPQTTTHPEDGRPGSVPPQAVSRLQPHSG